MLGWEDIPATVVPLDDVRAELAEIDENLAREDLTVLERGEHLARHKELYEALHSDAIAGARRAHGMNEALGRDVEEIISPTFADTAANTGGVTPRTVRQEVQIATAIADDVREIIKGDGGLLDLADSKTELLDLAKTEPELQRPIVERIQDEQAANPDKKRMRVREAKRLLLAESLDDVPLPDGKYRVILADPPWQYGNTSTDNMGEQRDHYRTMTIDELCDMPVENMADDNAVLFLWVTSPILEDAFRVIHAWGFEYKASFVWDKVKHVMGHYNSVRHEFLLVCTRGACQPDERRLFDSVVTEERTEHSRKPETFRTIIDTIYPYGNRVELFSRTTAEGWDTHGNE
jgi:N6-adenosine-specific RNA methylase IME4